MKTREEIEKNINWRGDTDLYKLMVEILLDIRDQNAEIIARLADSQANRNRFHVDSHPS